MVWVPNTQTEFILLLDDPMRMIEPLYYKLFQERGEWIYAELLKKWYIRNS